MEAPRGHSCPNDFSEPGLREHSLGVHCSPHWAAIPQTSISSTAQWARDRELVGAKPGFKAGMPDSRAGILSITPEVWSVRQGTGPAWAGQPLHNAMSCPWPTEHAGPGRAPCSSFSHRTFLSQPPGSRSLLGELQPPVCVGDVLPTVENPYCHKVFSSLKSRPSHSEKQAL